MTALSPRTRFLVVLMGSLGDVVRGLSIVDRIKSWSADARITWLVEPRCEAVVRAHPGIDRVLVFPRRSVSGGIVSFLRELRREKYDVALDLQRHFKSGILTFFSGAPRRIGFHPENGKELNWLFQSEFVPWVSERKPKLFHYHLFLEQLKIPESPRRFGLDVWAKGAPALNTPVPESAIGVVLTSTWESKNWPEEHYAAFLSLIRATVRRPIVFLGDASAVTIASRLEGPDITNLVGKTSLQQLASVISRIALLVGPDSGPGHFAGALGVPFVSIFGPTSPERVSFYGSEHLAVSSSLGCAPCYRKGCPGIDKLCMKSVTPEMVVEMVRRSLKSQGDTARDIRAGHPR